MHVEKTAAVIRRQEDVDEYENDYYTQLYMKHKMTFPQCTRGCGPPLLFDYSSCVREKLATLLELANGCDIGVDNIQVDTAPPAQTVTLGIKNLPYGDEIEIQTKLSSDDYQKLLDAYMKYSLGKHEKLFVERAAQWVSTIRQLDYGTPYEPNHRYLAGVPEFKQMKGMKKLDDNGGTHAYDRPVIGPTPDPLTLLSLIYVYPGFQFGYLVAQHSHGN